MLVLQDKKYKEEIAQAHAKIAALQNIQEKQQKTAETSYIDEFCPEFLSPEESLQLFGQLLTKL